MWIDIQNSFDLYYAQTSPELKSGMKKVLIASKKTLEIFSLINMNVEG